MIEPEEFKDDRGFLKRSFSQKEFAEHGLNPNVAECNISFSKNRYTIRGSVFKETAVRAGEAGPLYEGRRLRCNHRFAGRILRPLNSG